MSIEGELRRGAVINFLGIAGKMAGPAFLLVVTRLYGAEVFGVYLSAATLVEIAVALLTSGFRDAAVLYVARHAEHDREALYRALANAFGLSLAAALVLVALGQLAGAPAVRALYGFGDALAPAVRVMALVLPLMAFERVVLAATQGLRKMGYEAFVGGGLKPVVLLAAALALYPTMPTVEGLTLAWVAAQAVTGLAAFGIYGREFAWAPLGRALRRFRLHRELLGFAIPQNLNMTLNRFLMGMDVLMLGALGASAATVGVYGAGAAVVRELRQVKLAFSGALAPQIARLHARGDLEALSRVYSSTSRWAATLGLLAVLGVAGLHEDLLRLFYPGYEGPAAFMLWLLPVPYLVSAFGLAGNVVVMTGHSRLNLMNSLAVGAVNVGFNLLLIPPFGMVGAAAASSLAALSLAALELFEAAHFVGVRLRLREVYRPHLAGLVGLGVLVALRAAPLGEGLALRAGATLAAAAAYGLVLWALPGRVAPPEAAPGAEAVPERAG